MVFIGMDDIIAQPGQKPAYVGGLREDQFAFLEAYLPTIPKDKLVAYWASISRCSTHTSIALKTARACSNC